jgi:putative inorganic carbon (hco3(-)) transporter
MTATAMTAVGTRSDETLARVTGYLLLGFVGALQISIAVAEILLAATVVGWAALLLRDKIRPSAPAFFLPLAAYAGATLIASAFSADRAISFVDDKQLVLFAIVPMVYDLARGRRASLVVDVIVSVGAASAAFGIVQYGVLHYDNLGRRPEGALTHYMTYSGILMLVLCAAVARLVFGSRDRTWPALVMPALVVALALTFTRSAWVGAAAGVGLLFVLKDFRLTALLPVIVAVAFAIAPQAITNRMTSMFNAQDPANQDRLAMVEVGARMIAQHPLTGVGPNMVPRVYEQYRPDYAVNPVNPHLHNVPLQIGAERGVPALLVWLWAIGTLTLSTFRLFRRSTDRILPAATLASVAAMFAAGFFEYNFGDSEFLMMFLVLATLPFAAARSSIQQETRA